jgi:hypothetical protein
MTRWLLIVLIFLLPAQSSWAAAAGYCAHESNPVSFHVGHHAHVHQVSTPDAQHTPSEQENAKATLALEHDDCSYCHGVVVQLASPTSPMFEPLVRHAFASTSTQCLGGDRGASIERPKWTRAS